MRIAPARLAALRCLAALDAQSAPAAEGESEAADWDSLQERWLGDPLLADPRDRRLFSQLTAGVLRQRGRLDARLRRLTGRRQLDPPLREALRLALYQLETLDRLPAHAVIGESVEWVKRAAGPRLAGWANAQLRKWQREGVPGADPAPADYLAHAEAVLSLPRWLAERWRAEFGVERALRLMAALNRPPAHCFRWNALRPGQTDLLAALRAAGGAPEPIAGLPLAFRWRGAWPEDLAAALGRGDLSVQDASSQRIAALLDGGAPGDWADLCAAPGGKCCHLAERGGDARPLLAVDRDPRRLEKVVANARRLGLRGLQVECGDLRALAPRPVDGVLLDAPCSALGTLASNPDARWRLRPADIPRLAMRQRELLAAAARWPRPGGRLLYAVCTFTPEETSAQRDWFLGAHAEFALEPFTAAELPDALRTPLGEYLSLPDLEPGTAMYAFRCRRRPRAGAEREAAAKEEA